jgi:hypothetical protein
MNCVHLLQEEEIMVAFYGTDDKYIGWSEGFLSRTQNSYFRTAKASGIADPFQND